MMVAKLFRLKGPTLSPTLRSDLGAGGRPFWGKLLSDEREAPLTVNEGGVRPRICAFFLRSRRFRRLRFVAPPRLPLPEWGGAYAAISAIITTHR